MGRSLGSSSWGSKGPQNGEREGRVLKNIACLGAMITLCLVVFLGHHGFQIPTAPLLLQTPAAPSPVRGCKLSVCRGVIWNVEVKWGCGRAGKSCGHGSPPPGQRVGAHAHCRHVFSTSRSSACCQCPRSIMPGCLRVPLQGDGALWDKHFIFGALTIHP